MICELCQSSVGVGPVYQCWRCGAQVCERCMSAGDLCHACDDELADEERRNEERRDQENGA